MIVPVNFESISKNSTFFDISATKENKWKEIPVGDIQEEYKGNMFTGDGLPVDDLSGLPYEEDGQGVEVFNCAGNKIVH